MQPFEEIEQIDVCARKAALVDRADNESICTFIAAQFHGESSITSPYCIHLYLERRSVGGVAVSCIMFSQGDNSLHKKVFHKAFEYVTEEGFTTNNVENFFGLFKRGFKTYSHCGEQHLQRYLTEFAYRYSRRKISDTDRAEQALIGIGGKRLTYRSPNETQNGQTEN